MPDAHSEVELDALEARIDEWAQRQLLDEYLEPALESNSAWKQTVTVALATGAVVSAGYALIVARVATWLFTILNAQPVWRRFDALEVLLAWEEEKKRRAEEDGESLRSLVDKKRANG